MDDRLQEHGFQESEYERTNRWWKCGHADEGCPCHVGPDAFGRCRATYECSPVKKGDRWECTRPPRRGGSCEHGPRPDGTCACPIETCQPELTVRAKRGLTTVGAAALTLGLVLAVFAGPWFEETRRSVLHPGDVSRAHAGIEECAACHEEATPAGDAAAAGMAGGTAADGDSAAAGDTAGGGDPHAGLDLSGRCMTCHVPAGDRPLEPHGLAADTLDRIRGELARDSVRGDPPLALRLAALGPGAPTGPDDGLSCATCHREHRGRDASLTAMDRLRCQSCHSVQFASFDRGHPELDLPGPREELPYAFDHAAHRAEHFPDEDVEFTCARCHGDDAGGRDVAAAVGAAAPGLGGGGSAGSMGEKSFETMCGDCHTGQIRDGSLTVLQLPGIDFEILDQSGVSVGTWPIDAGIDVLAPISPVTEALLSADSAAAEDLRTLRGVDLTFLEGLGQDTLEAAGDMAWEVKEVFHELSTGGRDAMADRLARGLGVELSGREATALTDQRAVDEPRPRRPGWLPLVRSASEAWLPGLEGELSRREAGRTPGLDVYEAYGQPGPAPEGWMVDSFDFTIRYLPSGHADVFLRTLVEVSARTASEDSTAAYMFDRLTSEDGPGSCGKCHSPSTDERGTGIWEEGDAGVDLGRLTRFDHDPHLVVSCTDCHTVDTGGGVRPAGRRTCASCHGSDRASASCLNCHSYHSEGFALNVERALHPPAERDTADGVDPADGDDPAADETPADSAGQPEGGSG